MQTVEKQSLESKLEKIGNVLRLTGWIGLSAQIDFGAIALLMLAFAIAGRNFERRCCRLIRKDTALLPE